MEISFGKLKWEVNPTELKIKFVRNIGVGVMPNTGEQISSNTLGLRKAQGRGYFVGENAKALYAELEKLFLNGYEECLFIPGSEGFIGVITELNYIGLNSKNALEYSFVITEINSQINSWPSFHIAKSGERLWDIAYKYHIDIYQLSGMNPQIPYINCLKEGAVVKLR